MKDLEKEAQHLMGRAGVRVSMMLLTLAMLSAILALPVIQIAVADSSYQGIRSDSTVITFTDDSITDSSGSWPEAPGKAGPGERDDEPSWMKPDLSYLPALAGGYHIFRN